MLEVIITLGGTISRIDNVRHIGNFSKGTTGAHLAEEFLKQGHKVHYICSTNARRAFRRNMQVDPDKNIADELVRVNDNLEFYDEFKHNLNELFFSTFDEYMQLVKHTVTTTDSDAIVLSAAVSDYGVQQTEGKISSDLDEMTLYLQRLPKVIKRIKSWDPKIFQVGFKLLSTSIPNLIDAAYRHGIDSHNNLTVANTLDRYTVVITPEKGLTPITDITTIAPKLVEIITQRYSSNHYRTRQVEVSCEDTKPFKDIVNKFYNLNMFEPYYEGADMHFGFVASRQPEGFLITARGSNKENISDEDIVYVRDVDETTRTLTVSTGKKASLNANVAAKIFKTRPDVDTILHAHIFPGVDNVTETDYSPGTQEDVDEVLKFLEGHSIVELKNHGIISLGNSVEDILATLPRDPAYTRFPELYDLIYRRFLTSKFTDFALQHIEKHEKIIDLAAGTGEVSRILLENGHENILMVDKSRSMLDVARQKLDLPTGYGRLDYLEGLHNPDVVVCRQAINYAMNRKDLLKSCRYWFDILNPEGRFIFNAPNYVPGKEYGPKHHQYEAGGWQVDVNEMNALEGNILTHTQRCSLLRENGSEFHKVYDLNRFGLFTRDEFQSVLEEAGFTVKIEASPSSLYVVGTKNNI